MNQSRKGSVIARHMLPEVRFRRCFLCQGWLPNEGAPHPATEACENCLALAVLSGRCEDDFLVDVAVLGAVHAEHGALAARDALIEKGDA